MRFADPESGRLFDVFQQHTHLSDDVWFHPTEPKSFRISPEQYQTMVGRILDDMVDRFHTPYGVIIHPGNWAQFSSEQGKSLIAEAQMRDIPVWSYDQWCRFWDLRDRWRVTETEWKDDVLRFTAAGPPADGDLSLMLPAWFGDLELDSVVRNGLSAPLNPQLRAGETVYFASIDENLESCQIEASYARSSGATQ
jgi:hypothetical protein